MKEHIPRQAQTDRRVARKWPGVTLLLSLIPGAVALAGPAGAAGLPVAQGATYEAPPTSGGSWFWPTLVFLVVLLLLFIVFRYFVFRFFIRYFSPGLSRLLTVCLFLLYTLTWTIFGAYALFLCLFGLWKWVLVFLAAVWFIWFIVLMLRRDESVYFE